MNIGIDVNILLIDKAGPAVYTKELIDHLRKIDNENTYKFFSYGKNIKKGKTFRSKIENLIRDSIWSSYFLPYKLKIHEIDLLHCPAIKAPTKCSVPVVVTFYDMYILRNPKAFNSYLRLYCKFMLPKIAKNAAKIIAVSEFSKKDLINILSVPEGKVVVIKPGVNDTYHVCNDSIKKDECRRKYNLEKEFILNVGSIEPRKNTPFLLKAYAQLKKKGAITHQLVFTGGTGWKNKDVFTLINNIDIKDDVKFLGYVSEADLPIIYNLADLFIYPSLFEGFGMPVLEAMACGCPVITSNTSSLPEVVGDAAIMIDPFSIEELKGAIYRVICSNTLRQELREKGLERTKLFSWERCARETLEVYKSVI